MVEIWPFPLLWLLAFTAPCTTVQAVINLFVCQLRAAAGQSDAAVIQPRADKLRNSVGQRHKNCGELTCQLNMCCVNVPRIATSGHGDHKPGNVEYSGNSLNLEFSGNSVQPQEKSITNKIVLVQSNICVK